MSFMACFCEGHKFRRSRFPRPFSFLWSRHAVSRVKIGPVFGFITAGRMSRRDWRDKSCKEEKATVYPELMSFNTSERFLPEFFHFHSVWLDFLLFKLLTPPLATYPLPVCPVSSPIPFLCCHFAFLSPVCTLLTYWQLFPFPIFSSQLSHFFLPF